MEALSCLINRAIDGNYLSGIRVANGRGEDLSISHLLYADDTLIFCEDDIEQLKFLSWILMWFEAMLGLKINLTKSEIIPIGPVNNLVELASELGCNIGSLPTSYLGLPLGAKHGWGVGSFWVGLWFCCCFVLKCPFVHVPCIPGFLCFSLILVCL